MTQNNGPSTGNEMILSPRQEKLVALRDEMSPGQRPGPIVPRTFGEAQAMCAALARSGLVPNMYIDKPENMIVTIMAGAELGLPPMASLRLYHIMDSIPRLSAEGIRAVLVSHPEIEYFEPHSCDDKHATWIGKRRGRPEKSATWTVDQAKRAGLWDRKNRDGSPGNWQKYTEDMLNARASMRLGRMIAPDIMAGMVSREEASDGDFIDAQTTETRSAPAFVAPPPAMPNFVVTSAQAAGPIAAQGGAGGSSNTAQTGSAVIIGAPTPKVVEPQGPPPGVPQPPAEKPKRERGAAAVRPTTPAAGSSKESSPPAAVAQQTGSSESFSSSNGSSPVSSSAASEPAASPTSAPSTTAHSPSVESAQTSSPASGAAAPDAPSQSSPADDFGGEDPVDTPAQPDPVEAKLAEFHAWLKGCATQRDLVGGLAAWRAWSKDMSDTHGDLRFRKGGEITIAMQDAYSKRKGEVPA